MKQTPVSLISNAVAAAAERERDPAHQINWVRDTLERRRRRLLVRITLVLFACVALLVVWGLATGRITRLAGEGPSFQIGELRAIAAGHQDR